MTESFSRDRTPAGGWFYRQAATGWTTPTPIASTFRQTVQLIIAHRKANPAITAKHQLATNPEAVGSELETYTRKRLGLPGGGQVPFPESHNPSLFRAAGAAVDDLKRAASGTAVVLDWLRSGGEPVAQELANKRGAICVECPQNVAGSWFTTAPAQLIKETLEARKDLKLETPHDDKLKSCGICKCLLKLKAWTPLEFILAKTKPEILAEFPPHCWIATQDA